MENRDENNATGLTELEKTYKEYKSKLERADDEARQIVELAWKKADTIISNQQEEAQKLVEEMRQKSTTQADRVVREARDKADEIEKEADARAKKEAKDRTRREAEKLIAETKKAAEKDAADIIENAKAEAQRTVENARKANDIRLREESEQIIGKVKDKARRIDREADALAGQTNELIAEISKKAVDVFNQNTARFQSELAELASALEKGMDEMRTKSLLVRNEAGGGNNGNGDGKAVRGSKELVIMSPYTGTQVNKLTEFLKQVPGISIKGDSATEENYSIFLNMLDTVPLSDLLLDLPLVKSSDVKGDTIRLVLSAGENGSRNYN